MLPQTRCAVISWASGLTKRFFYPRAHPPRPDTLGVVTADKCAALATLDAQ